ncbi:hypothetical protein RX327_32155 [Bradyrhizobium sp. BEA-2-5]|uniref:hypothetical protein n=1 Tax=Bradyrhizobium sp. BEA-2-5 TaxID=3080015 RepID=UPI00293EE875|nr:hypothetical protein [Bradyrhizobium sp. BEA-2-5]WOH80408.1 hypothetical protein RX327_32155 [Bradyrhizobium sp. BEA-2-5]
MNNPQLGQSKLRLALRRPKLAFYGAPVGILLLERTSTSDPFDRPFIPGSVGNASTWSVPVRFKTIPGLSFTKLIASDEDYASVVVQAASELVREGARMITAHCGFMIRYQDAVRAAVDVPVVLSPLLLIPLLGQMLPCDKAVGIITAKSSSLTPEVLKAAGVPTNFDRVAVAGLEHAPCFAAAFLTAGGDLDVSAVEKETVDASVALLNSRPDIGVLLFECSELPPYAAAVQRATGIPVFDFTSMVEFVIGGVIRKPFTGIC